jgi:hypothetical protein
VQRPIIDHNINGARVFIFLIGAIHTRSSPRNLFSGLVRITEASSTYDKRSHFSSTNEMTLSIIFTARGSSKLGRRLLSRSNTFPDLHAIVHTTCSHHGRMFVPGQTANETVVCLLDDTFTPATLLKVPHAHALVVGTGKKELTRGMEQQVADPRVMATLRGKRAAS